MIELGHGDRGDEVCFSDGGSRDDDERRKYRNTVAFVQVSYLSKFHSVPVLCVLFYMLFFFATKPKWGRTAFGSSSYIYWPVLFPPLNGEL